MLQVLLLDTTAWHTVTVLPGITLTVSCLINLEGKGHKPGAATMNLLPWHAMVLASMNEVTVPQGTCLDPVQKGRVAWARLAHAGAGSAWFSPVFKSE